MAKVTPKKVHALFKPATKRNEQGMASMTVLNRIKSGKPIPAWAIKAAGIRAPATAPKRRGA